jgi:hypothetical protein
VNDTVLLGEKLSILLKNTTINCALKPSPQYSLDGAIPQFYKGANTENQSLPDAEYCYLTAIKYWNLVNYFYPQQQNCKPKWSNSLPQIIEKFGSIRSYKSYYFSLLQLSHQLYDGHARIYSPWASDSLFPFKTPFESEVYEEYAIVTLVDTSMKIVQTGDRIIEINHTSIKDKISFWDTLISTSTRGWFLHTVRNTLFANSDSIMSLTLIRNYDTLNLSIPLVKSNLQSEISSNLVYTLNKDSIGYINLGNLQNHHLESMKIQLKKAKIIIIDARGYPNSTLMGLSEWMIDEGKVFANHLSCNPLCLGAINNKNKSKTVYNQKERFEGTILFLVDRSTISQGEFMVMAFMQSPNVITIGRPSAGSNGVTTRFKLPGNIECRISTSSVYFPNNSPIQQVGIIPSINLTESTDVVTSEDLLTFAYKYASILIHKP